MFAVALTIVFFFVGATSLAGGQNSASWKIVKVDRQILVDNIAYYRFDVVVGPGHYDKIRIHRVVKERAPYQPLNLPQAVMFFPGEPTYFATLYIESLIDKGIARDRSIAIYLAEHNIDVWGMDYRWALVPEDTTNFTFMKDWGAERDVQDGEIALTIARMLRGSFLQPAGPMFVSGLSYGAQIDYGIASDDLLLPAVQRNVKGIIPLDNAVIFKELQADDCTNAAQVKATIDSGTYYSDNRSMWQMGSLALSHPSGTSPFDPTVDNYVFALEVAEYPEQPQIPWHFAGGWFDRDTGLPTGLIFTEDRLWFELLKYNEPPYYPIRVDYETEAVDCGNSFPDVTFAFHMSQISVPIFLVGAIGGFGHSSDYNTSLTQSKDVQILIVQALSNGMQASDYGHVDLLTARDADTRVWRPILDWIVAHP
jgi:hypothetical protein